MGIGDKFDEMKDKVKEKAEEMKGNKGRSSDMDKERSGSMDKEHSGGMDKKRSGSMDKERSGGMGDKIDKGANYMNEKTGGKYEKQVKKGADKAKDMMDKRNR